MQWDDLVAAVLAGDSKAWTELGRRLRTELYSYYSRRLSDADAADLVQTTCVIVLRKIPNFRIEAGRPFQHWLRAIARVQVLEAYRQQRRRQRLSDGLELVPETPATSLGSRLDRVHRFDLIQEELGKLDGLYQRAILNDLDGGDAATLAEREQIKQGSARTRRRRAQQMLRHRLRARGAVTADSNPASR